MPPPAAGGGSWHGTHRPQSIPATGIPGSTSANTPPTKHIAPRRSLARVTALTWRTLRRGGGTALRRGGGVALRCGGGAVTSMLIVIAGLVAGTGWLYILRGLHWLDLGPRIS